MLLLTAGLSPEAIRGRQIFEHGQTADGVAIEAVVGADVTVPALACATCHGVDGLGRPEGAVRPADVRWATLSRSRKTGRPRAGYDEAALTRAIAMGRRPGGEALDRVMPRYRLTVADQHDLLAYLRTLGERQDPGVGDDVVTLGVLSASGTAGSSMMASVRAWADELNGRGGVFARRIELRQFPGEAGALAALSEQDQPFAFVGGSPLDPADPVAAWMRAARIPFLRTQAPGPSSRNPAETVFDLGPSLTDELRALLQSAAASGPCSLFVWPSESRGLAADPGRASGCWLVADVRDAKVVLPLAPDFPAELGRGRLVLLPSSLASELAGSLCETAAEVQVATALLPHDVAPGALQRYAELPPGNRLPQVSALALARTIEEALVRAGRTLSREGLLQALGGIRNFDTGFGPPVTLAPDPHEATARVHVLRLEAGSLHAVTH